MQTNASRREAGSPMNKKIGVLALQGSAEEHLGVLMRLDSVIAIPVHTKEELKSVDALILPGGESSVIGKLLHIFDLFDLLKERIQDGMPVWGTCAGTILLANHIVGEDPYLSAINITVARNAYGRQIDSFCTKAIIPQISNRESDLIFIRAPKILSWGNDVDILCRLGDSPVALRSGNVLVTAFHPELTDDPSFHRYFASMIR